MKITSSNSYLQNLAEWAQNKSRQFIMTDKSGDINKGEGGKWYGPSGKILKKSRVTKKQNKPWTKPQKYIPSYWAGYYDRTAFYIRDFVHQAPGAEYLGYSEENYEMLKSFVSLAGRETNWYAPWALNFDGSIYYMDTPNHKNFVRELPAQYELVETICKLYMITGDKRYIEQSFLNFAEMVLNDFTENLDGIVFSERNGIPEGVGNLWKGSASYNESGKAMAEAGDCIAALYKALACYGQLLSSLNNSEKSAEYLLRAQKLKQYFNDVWSVAPDGKYAFGIDKNGIKHYEWTKSPRGIIGGETCFIMPLKHLIEAGERNNRLLDYIDEKAKNKKTCMQNIESYTYLPQVFFSYRKAENAWHWIKFIGDRIHSQHIKASQGENGDYPEVSYTTISHVIEGLIGFSADIPNKRVETFPCLPGEINDISVQELNLREYSFDVSVSKNSASLTNKSKSSISWKCGFEGRIDKLAVNGRENECSRETVDGVDCSFVTVTVSPDSTVSVSL